MGDNSLFILNWKNQMLAIIAPLLSYSGGDNSTIKFCNQEWELNYWLIDNVILSF
jgi:hypothetical protein